MTTDTWNDKSCTLYRNAILEGAPFLQDVIQICDNQPDDYNANQFLLSKDMF